MAIKALAKGDELDIELSGVVGDGWADNPITSKALAKVLADNKGAKFINGTLNSPGGYVVEGLQIYQMLADHQAHVTITVGAQASSCGSLILMAADKRIVHETSLVLAHNPWDFTVGDYLEHDSKGAELKTLADVFAGVYASRSGMSKDDALALMAKDQYVNAEEALRLGLCDEILKSKSKQALSVNEARSSVMQARAFAMNNMRRAAVAVLLPNNDFDATTQKTPEATENTENMGIQAAILAALCLSEGATEMDAVASIQQLKASKDASNELLSAVGAKTASEAVGAIEGLKESAKAGALAITELKELREKASKDKHEALISQASKPLVGAADPSNPHAGKLTPAMAAWAKSVSTETLEGFLAHAPVVLAGDGAKEPHAQRRSYSGKAYSDMSFEERHELAKADPDLFAQLSREYEEAQL